MPLCKKYVVDCAMKLLDHCVSSPSARISNFLVLVATYMTSHSHLSLPSSVDVSSCLACSQQQFRYRCRGMQRPEFCARNGGQFGESVAISTPQLSLTKWAGGRGDAMIHMFSKGYCEFRRATTATCLCDHILLVL